MTSVGDGLIARAKARREAEEECKYTKLLIVFQMLTYIAWIIRRLGALLSAG